MNLKHSTRWGRLAQPHQGGAGHQWNNWNSLINGNECNLKQLSLLFKVQY